MNITSPDTFTTAVLIQGGKPFDISVRGTFVATVTVQRSKDGNTDWKNVESFTAPIEKTGEAGSAWFWRIGVPAGSFTSGAVTADIY